MIRVAKDISKVGSCENLRMAPMVVARPLYTHSNCS